MTIGLERPQRSVRDSGRASWTTSFMRKGWMCINEKKTHPCPEPDDYEEDLIVRNEPAYPMHNRQPIGIDGNMTIRIPASILILLRTARSTLVEGKAKILVG